MNHRHAAFALLLLLGCPSEREPPEANPSPLGGIGSGNGSTDQPEYGEGAGDFGGAAQGGGHQTPTTPSDPPIGDGPGAGDRPGLGDQPGQTGGGPQAGGSDPGFGQGT